MITQQESLELFEYKNGDLIRKKNNKVMKSPTYFGHLRARIKGKNYLVHRLVFLMHHGHLPKQIDHIDGNPANNKIDNLREASQSQNMWNRNANTNSMSKIKGIKLHQSGKYQVRVQVNKKSMYLGLYVDLELAELVAIEARNKFHGVYANHG
jgi:hypothetical protein